MEQALFHLVYLRSGPILLTKKPYRDWREIQDEFDDYMTSLGPWSAPEVLDFLEFEYPKIMSKAEGDRINEFLESDAETLKLFTPSS